MEKAIQSGILLLAFFTIPVKAESAAVVHSTVIDAEISLVWDILTKFSRYGTWNTWIPALEGQPVEGQTVLASVNMGPFTMNTLHKVTTVIPGEKLCWDDISWFTFLVGGSRCRTLTFLNSQQTLLENHFTFSGFFRSPGGYLFHSPVSRGMVKENRDLKSEAERRSAPTQITS